ncbi:MAG: PHP domain-containing protein, partial [Gemmatimonadales bacterium]
MPRRVPLFPISLMIAIVAALVLGTPALSDPTGAALPPSVHLHFPWLNLIFAPLFDLWDGVSMLSLSRLKAWAVWLAAFYVVWRIVTGIRRRRREPDAGPPVGVIRELGLALLALALFLGFVGAGMLWHRPMAGLAGVPADWLAVDMHTHTNASHDVKGTLMGGYDAQANRRWHARAGFDAEFITDHNTIDGWLAALPPGAPHPDSTHLTLNHQPPFLCPGIEVSAWRAHIVLLGATEAVDRSGYADSLGGVLQLFRDAWPRYRAVAIASIPEYDRNHWNNLGAFVRAGVDGFEIVNAAPKANEFSRAHRDSVIALARGAGLLLTGVSDNHGWGATSMAWTLVSLPGWRTPGFDVCGRMVDLLHAHETDRVQIVERHHLQADAWWP